MQQHRIKQVRPLYYANHEDVSTTVPTSRREGNANELRDELRDNVVYNAI